MSAEETVVDCASPRFRPAAFFVRMWLLKALALLNFPVAVFRNRFAAPRWVFSFGMADSFRGPTAPRADRSTFRGARRRGSGLAALLVHAHRREDLVQAVAEHLRARLGHGLSGEVLQ